ncbi:MAG: hypothetical protein AB9903_23365 [Vulcanimicrobiota bacterium]
MIVQFKSHAGDKKTIIDGCAKYPWGAFLCSYLNKPNSESALMLRELIRATCFIGKGEEIEKFVSYRNEPADPSYITPDDPADLSIIRKAIRKAKERLTDPKYNKKFIEEEEKQVVENLKAATLKPFKPCVRFNKKLNFHVGRSYIQEFFDIIFPILEREKIQIDLDRTPTYENFKSLTETTEILGDIFKRSRVFNLKSHNELCCFEFLFLLYNSVEKRVFIKECGIPDCHNFFIVHPKHSGEKKSTSFKYCFCSYHRENKSSKVMDWRRRKKLKEGDIQSIQP